MTKVKIVKHISDKGYPVHNKKYAHAHEQANKAEKKADPKEFKKSVKLMEKMERKNPHELMATHKKSGKIEIEKKYAKNRRLKKDLIVHEETEAKVEDRKKK